MRKAARAVAFIVGVVVGLLLTSGAFGQVTPIDPRNIRSMSNPLPATRIPYAVGNGTSTAGLSTDAGLTYDAATDTLSTGARATGGNTTRTLADHFADELNARDFGALGNGITDDTSAVLGAIVASAGVAPLRLSAGPSGAATTYLINTADATGYAVANSVHIVCDPGVTVSGAGQAGDIFRLKMPTNGAGLPADGIPYVWFDGCRYDQTAQKNSTSIPYSGSYPATVLPTTTATAEAISVRGAYTTAANTITASAAADTITTASDNGFVVRDPVRFTTTGTLPGGISASTTYYVANITSTTVFQVATTPGGAALNITSAGTGTNSVTATKAGIQKVIITNASCYAGTHWTVAGGDSCIYVDGAQIAITDDNYCQGSRDLCLYLSGDSTGALQGLFYAHGNRAKDVVGGIAVKRAAGGGDISGNDCENCVIAYAAEHVTGITGRNHKLSIHHNHARQARNVVRLDFASVDVMYNRDDYFGAVLADGISPAINTLTPAGIALNGCNYCQIIGNTNESVGAGYSGSNSYIRVDFSDADSGTVQSQYNTITDNSSNGFASIGGELVSGGGNNNRFAYNYEFVGTHYVTIDGAASRSDRYDWTTGAITHIGCLVTLPCTSTVQDLYASGSASIPPIALNVQTTTGFFGATGQLSASIAGTERWRLGATGATIPNGVLIGTLGNAQQTIASATPLFQIQGSAAGNSAGLFGRWSADTGSSDLRFLKSRNTSPGSFTTVASGDFLGSLSFYGDDGTSYGTLGVQFFAKANGTVSTGIVQSLAELDVSDSSGVMQQAQQWTSAATTFRNAYNIVFGTGSGTKIGTGTTQKLAFYNSTPIAQSAATTDLGTVLSDLGLRAAGTAYPITTSGLVTIGSGTAATGSAGELAMAKIAATGTAPGANYCKEEWVCGTNAGSAKKIAYCGTSTTPVTIVDNVGSGVTGC